MTLKLLVYPIFDSLDKGDGGIRRVVEAQQRYLPEHDIELVTDMGAADIVATHGGSWLETPPSLPTVSHCHGLYWTDTEYEWHTNAHKINANVISNLRKADCVTAPSKWVARILRRGMQLEAPVLYHGIEPSDWTPGSKSEPYVLWNKTRVDPICDPSIMNALAKMAPDTKFVSTFGQVANNVTITGRMPFDQARAWVEGASVYLCNTRETFGIGTLEAMLCEVPVLAWEWGGQREIVEHKVTGWLAKPGDYDSLLEGLVYCLENRAKLGAAAREHVIENFSLKNIMGRYAALYKMVAERHRKLYSGARASVIITCYNLAELLPRAVASVQAQTEQDIEIVIVNDASPDSTATVAASLAADDPRIKIVNNESNLYLAGSLNAGVVASCGRYIVPLDADNELAPDAIQILADALDNGYKQVDTQGTTAVTGRELDIVYGSLEWVRESGAKREVSPWPPQEFDYSAQLSHHNQIPSTSMYRRRVWERIQGYRRRCHTAEDADFWCRATSYGMQPRKVTDAVTLIYWDRDDSMSHVQKDWSWHEWYSWSRYQHLTPFGAAKDYEHGRTTVPTYEPTKITVVIPVGPGHGKYVLDALDSLQSQTFTRWDCIVVNDSGESLGPLPPFVRLFETAKQGRKGPAFARNLGVANVGTPLWLPLDADDYLQPEALDYLYKAWEPNTYVYCDWITQETGEAKQAPDYDCSQLLNGLPHPITCLFETAAWRAVSGFDSSLKAWEDWDFVLALAAKGYCGVRVPVPLLQYRLHAGSRREELYAKREELEKEIATKWHKYIIQKEPLMACGCSAGKSGSRAANAPPVWATMAVGDNGNELVMMEYIGGGGGARTYVGQVTGTAYRFGGDPEHKKRYVLPPDVPTFLQRNEFRVVGNGMPVSAPTPVLQAVGPPVRA